MGADSLHSMKFKPEILQVMKIKQLGFSMSSYHPTTASFSSDKLNFGNTQIWINTVYGMEKLSVQTISNQCWQIKSTSRMAVMYGCNTDGNVIMSH